MPEIRTKISGVTYADPQSKINRQDLIRKFVKPGMELQAKREPNNPQDPAAVGLWMVNRSCLGKKRFHLGYVHRDQASRVTAVMDTGHKVTVRVTEVTGGTGEKRTLGVNVVVRYT